MGDAFPQRSGEVTQRDSHSRAGAASVHAELPFIAQSAGAPPAKDLSQSMVRLEE